MTSPRLKILERQMLRKTPEQAPVPASDDLAAAIERVVQERVEQALDQRPVKPPAHVQRIRDQFDAPAPYTDFKQIPPTPTPKRPPAFESLVSQRDHLGRIAKMVSKPLAGDGPTFESVITQRDENGRIVRMTTSVIDTPPDNLGDPR